MRTGICFILTVLIALTVFVSAEDWTGYEKDYTHQNASATTLNGSLQFDWEKHFTEQIFWDGAGTSYQPDSYHHSRNLAIKDGYLALVASIHTVTGYNHGADVTVLDITDGSTVNAIHTITHRGGDHIMPSWDYIEAFDTAKGASTIAWGDGGVIYLLSGADHPGHTAFDVLANMGSFTGTTQDGIGAFTELYNSYPGLEDCMNYPAAGNTRVSLDDPESGGTADLGTTHWDYQNTGGSNGTAFFEIAPGCDWIACTTICDHRPAAGFVLVNKYTGLLGAKAQLTTITVPDYAAEGLPVDSYARVFGMWGAILINPVDATTTDIFFIGPGEDQDNDDQLGAVSWGDKDDGLILQCLRVTDVDNRSDEGYSQTINDAVDGLWRGAAIRYNYFHPSTGAAPTTKHDHESFNEQDLLYRNKAMMIVGDGVYCAWKPSQAGSVELVRTTPTVNQAWNLGVGAGLRGQDIWPNIAYSDLGTQGRYIAYYLANANYRAGSGATTWVEASTAPLGPAELAVFTIDDNGSDPEVNTLRWTYDLSAAYPSLPPNDAFGYIERSRMLVSGEHAYVAWVDLSGLNCVLKVAQFNLLDSSAPSTPPIPFSYDLGIPAASNRQTIVHDIAACDGRILVYILESDTMNFEYSSTNGFEFTWTGQRVVAITSDGGASVPGTLQVASTTYSVNEGAGTVVVIVTRTGGSSGTVGVSYATSNGTATAGSDYTAASSTLAWADGDSTAKTITVNITDDAADEPDETFVVTLSAATGGATLGTALTTVTIVDNDATPGDGDSDGMPDAWEMSNFGDYDQDETTDFDSDGELDIDEYYAGTDPTDPNDPPPTGGVSSGAKSGCGYGAGALSSLVMVLAAAGALKKRRRV